MTPAITIHPRTDHRPAPDCEADFETRYERILAQRAELRSRHSQALSRLMEERRDLHGVHALADFVADSLRWTA